MNKNFSPLLNYCQNMDIQYMDNSYMQLYYNVALETDTLAFTNLFLKDIGWRADNQLNILASIEGQQGSGKSLFGLDLSIRTGQFYGVPFNFDIDIFINPFLLEKELRFDKTPRRTYLYDEQPQRRVGIGSVSTQISLKDYEELGRFEQKNIYYCSPEVQDHAHYYIFRQVDYNISRLSNETCLKCSKYGECHKRFYSTLCEIPFYERDGYPQSFSFLLETKRLSDKMFMPRGIVTLPMLNPKSAEHYNRVKKKNMVGFSEFRSKYWEGIKDDLKDFVKSYHDVLIKVNSKGIFCPASLKRIEFYFYDHFSTQRFTKSQVDLFLPEIKERLTLMCDEKNNKDNVLNNSVKGV